MVWNSITSFLRRAPEQPPPESPPEVNPTLLSNQQLKNLDRMTKIAGIVASIFLIQIIFSFFGSPSIGLLIFNGLGVTVAGGFAHFWHKRRATAMEKQGIEESSMIQYTFSDVKTDIGPACSWLCRKCRNITASARSETPQPEGEGA